MLSSSLSELNEFCEEDMMKMVQYGQITNSKVFYKEDSTEMIQQWKKKTQITVRSTTMAERKE